jgi:release factor glutamine methyltransferase
MNVSTWLLANTTQLADAGITTARLDCLVLLEDATGRDRAWLLSHPEHKLQGSVLENLDTNIAQRAQHVPLAYLRGHAEFYGREFAVNEHTLVPRPETETIIERLIGLVVSGKLPAEPGILDIGTGSGCIAITAALELRAAGFDAHVSACDIDKNCLRTAKQNAQKLGATVHFFASDLLDGAVAAGQAYDILLANLPYVPDNFQINTAATHEPRRALFGGPDGLDLYRTMFQQIHGLASVALPFVLTESLPIQHENLATIAKAAGYHLQVTDDFIQLFVAA